MKIIKPSAEYMDPNDHPSLYQFIEKIGRTCYKSEDHINETSAVKFVAGLVNRAHWAMLEHGYIYMELSPKAQSMLAAMDDRDKRFLNICGNKMTANLRAMYDFLFRSSVPMNDAWRRLKDNLQHAYPEVFGDCVEGAVKGSIDFRVMSREEFLKLCIRENDVDALRVCYPHTMLFHVNRGVTHEYVRHRPASFAQESTRYCNYSKGKFGTEITVVAPFWAYENPMQKEALYHDWKEGCRDAEAAYMAMMDMGANPQEARANLPISVKADLIMTATEGEWEHILNLRAYGVTGAPHPDMRMVSVMAGPMLREKSGGRLYGKDFVEPKVEAEPTGKRYVFIEDADGDQMPLKWTDGSVLAFPSIETAGDFINKALTHGYIDLETHPVAKENYFLDRFAKKVTDMTGKTVKAGRNGMLTIAPEA